jgi:hypothetical protein
MHRDRGYVFQRSTDLPASDDNTLRLAHGMYSGLLYVQGEVLTRAPFADSFEILKAIDFALGNVGPAYITQLENT